MSQASCLWQACHSESLPVADILVSWEQEKPPWRTTQRRSRLLTVDWLAKFRMCWRAHCWMCRTPISVENRLKKRSRILKNSRARLPGYFWVIWELTWNTGCDIMDLWGSMCWSSHVVSWTPVSILRQLPVLVTRQFRTENMSRSMWLTLGSRRLEIFSRDQLCENVPEAAKRWSSSLADGVATVMAGRSTRKSCGGFMTATPYSWE